MRALTVGQKYAAALFPTPLPQAVVGKKLQQINQRSLRHAEEESK
jgi:hypothetical protein